MARRFTQKIFKTPGTLHIICKELTNRLGIEWDEINEEKDRVYVVVYEVGIDRNRSTASSNAYLHTASVLGSFFRKSDAEKLVQDIRSNLSAPVLQRSSEETGMNWVRVGRRKMWWTKANIITLVNRHMQDLDIKKLMYDNRGLVLSKKLGI